MSRTILFFRIALLFLVLPSFINAQTREIGIMLGASGYNGDITPSTNRISSGKRHASFGIFARESFTPYISGKGTLLIGKISGHDAKNENLAFRNLSFQSNIFELAGTIELTPLGNNGSYSRFQPRVYAGAAIFRFNPKAVLNGQTIALQPLGTEGQGMEGRNAKYRRTQISIPMGLALSYSVTENINIGIDFGIRKTFTDYLDDVSTSYVNYNDLVAGNGQLAATLANRQGELTGGEPVIVETGTQRGNSAKKDWYYNAALTVSYSFGHTGIGSISSGKGMGCPNKIQ